MTKQTKPMDAKAVIAKFNQDHPKGRAAAGDVPEESIMGLVGTEVIRYALPFVLRWLSRFVDFVPKSQG